MTETIGDTEPEDAWHPDDPVTELLDNLDRRCTQLGEPGKRHKYTRRGWLHDLMHRLERLKLVLDEMSERDRLRVRLLSEDIGFVAARMTDHDG